MIVFALRSTMLSSSRSPSEPEVARCFESVIEDAGPLDLAALFAETAEACKPGEENRSK